MADFLIWLVAALGAIGCCAVLSRVWGRTEGAHAGNWDTERDALQDEGEWIERGRDAVRGYRSAGDPADRSAGRNSNEAPPLPPHRRNAGRW